MSAQIPRAWAIDERTRELTNRNKQVLQLIADGHSNKGIAVVLGLRMQTIKNHVTTIMRRLDASSRAHAVAIAFRKGLVK